MIIQDTVVRQVILAAADRLENVGWTPNFFYEKGECAGVAILQVADEMADTGKPGNIHRRIYGERATLRVVEYIGWDSETGSIPGLPKERATTNPGTAIVRWNDAQTSKEKVLATLRAAAGVKS